MKVQKGIVSALILITGLLFVVSPMAVNLAYSAGPIKLSFVCFTTLTDKFVYQPCKQMFIDRVNEKAKGELEIVVRGGPEVIPPFDLGVAVQKGAIDMAISPTAFFESLVPGADSTKLSDYSAMEERQNGVYEYISDMYTKSGLHYVGRSATHPGYFFLFLNKKAEKPEDFKGLKLGGSPAFHGFYQLLGASVATIPLPEYQPAMERGVVDGIATSPSVALQGGIAEVSKYVINKGFYRDTAVLMMNLKKWNSLPDNLKNIISECVVEYEKQIIDFETKIRAETLDKIIAAGVKPITLSPETENWYMKAAIDGSWKYAQDRFPGDLIPELRKKITKGE